MKHRVIVSDHAILRYLERIIGVDLAQLRANLEREIAGAAKIGARSYTAQGATFVFETGTTGDIHVVTVLTDKMRRSTRHRRRGKPVAVGAHS